MGEDNNIMSASDVIQQRWQSVTVSNICIDYLMVKTDVHIVENRAEMSSQNSKVDRPKTNPQQLRASNPTLTGSAYIPHYIQ